MKIRPGKMGPKIEELMARLRERDSGVGLSATIRDALEAFWPQIEAFLLARQQTRTSTDDLVRLTSMCAKAIQLGVSLPLVEAVLTQQIEARLDTTGS